MRLSPPSPVDESASEAIRAAVILVHLPDADREALAFWLERRGHVLRLCDSLRDPELHPTVLSLARRRVVLVVQERLIASAEELDGLGRPGLLVLGNRRPLRLSAATVRLPELFGYKALGPAVDRAALSSGAAPASVAGADDHPSLLRGFAHALNAGNQEVLGWAQLIGYDLPEGADQSRLASLVKRIENGVGKIDRISSAMSIIGGRPSPLHQSVDLPGLVHSQAARAAASDFEVRVDVRGEGSGIIHGDGGELALVFELLFSSYADDAMRPEALGVHITLGREGIAVSIRDPKGLMDPSIAPEDLGLALQRLRHARALALGLASDVIGRRLSGTVALVPEAPGGSRLDLWLPTGDHAEDLAEDLDAPDAEDWS